MNPATFKLVLKYQKEYSKQTKDNHKQDRATIQGTKEWYSFWSATTKKVIKKLSLFGKKGTSSSKSQSGLF